MEKYRDTEPQMRNTERNGRPNILMLFSDEHHWQYSGYAGHAIVETPHLDRLASRGVSFSNAYCNSPLCSPSRQSFMAGLHCHKIGMWNNVCSMPENTVTWAHALHAAGYETLLCGKMHFNGYQKMYGFDRRPVLEGNNSGQQFYSWGYRTSHVWHADGVVKAQKGADGQNQDVVNAGPDTDERQPVFQHDKVIAEGTIDVLKEKAADPQGQPWALCCGMVLPHPPFTGRKDLAEKFKGTGIVPENMYGENLGECDQSLRAYLRMDGNEYTADDLKVVREQYYALIAEYDEYVGRILDYLDESGLAENTIVCYFSDHGEFAGEHGMIGKVSLRESSVRIPLIISWPNEYPQGITVEEPVSLVDLYPTFCDMAGYKLPEVLPLDGHSLVPLVHGKPEAFAGDGVFGEFEGEGWNHPRAFVRDGDYKYMWYHTSDPELYNVKEDYYEMHNLAGMPEYADIENKLKTKILQQWDPEAIEKEVILTQVRQQLAPCRNVCGDMGW